ncbi:hypothetical protein [Bacteroides pyogenes]|uniref:hypothetical protein n=1 Tax=Bacteroides pyogenes TaxID=310300 RepID=UPI001BA579E7|nr:hypothetical protein [Bacteroides pyogenes]MBR8704301.1 hypothetical protein [Bacteroides pyogenes]
MPATLRLYAYGPRPISPGLCAICSGVVCPIYTRRISIYSGVYLVRPGDVLYVLAYARYTPSVSLYAPSDTPCAYGPFPSLWRVPCVCSQRIPPIQAFFSEAMPLSESVAFHRKESDETPRPNQQTALASTIYTRVLQNREGRPPRARPCIGHLYPRTHRFPQHFGQVLSFFGPKPFHIILNYLSLRKKKRAARGNNSRHRIFSTAGTKQFSGKTRARLTGRQARSGMTPTL